MPFFRDQEFTLNPKADARGGGLLSSAYFLPWLPGACMEGLGLGSVPGNAVSIIGLLAARSARLLHAAIMGQTGASHRSLVLVEGVPVLTGLACKAFAVWGAGLRATWFIGALFTVVPRKQPARTGASLRHQWCASPCGMAPCWMLMRP